MASYNWEVDHNPNYPGRGNFEVNYMHIATAYNPTGATLDAKYTWTPIDNYGAGDDGFGLEDEMLDKDSYRNAKGRLRRFVLDNTCANITFNTRYLFQEDMMALCEILDKGMSLDDGFCSHKERNVMVKYYNPNKNKYEIAECYTPAPQWVTAGSWDVPRYNPTTIRFIDYGSKKD